MTLSQSALDVAQWLLATSELALSDCGREPISRSYVAAGDIAWDDCCGMLVVAPERVYRSQTFPAESTDEEICFGGYIAVDYVVLVVRCVPTVTDQGRAPSVSSLQAAYDSILEDAAVIYNAVTGDLPDYWVRSSVAQTFVGAQGGCIGVETRLTIGIEQDRWSICCSEPAPHEPGDPICKIPAGRVTFDPCVGLASTNVQDAICEIAASIPAHDVGSFYDTSDQIMDVDVSTALRLNTTSLSYGVSVQNSSEITVTTSGVYTLDFSAQIHHRGGGGAGTQIDIWLRKNGAAIPDTATRMIIPNNTYAVAAWDFLLDLAAGDYIELMYRTNNASIVLEAVDPFDDIPAVPSLIVNIAQVR